MKWSWKIATVAGIPIYIHATFLLLLVWVALSHYMDGGSVARAAEGVLFIGIVFAIVVLHELGHAITAKRFGIRTRDITLLPIGGVARLERMPDKPWQELLVAVAGPAVNVALAAVFFGVLAAQNRIPDLFATEMTRGSLVARLVWINTALAVFNMLPAFPMDGGRVLRALLAMQMDYVAATQLAARIGQGMALLFGILGLATNPFLAFIALFVWIGASEEAGAVQVRWALSGIPVARAMITDFRTLAPEDPLGRAMQMVLAGFQDDFLVESGGRVAGILTRARLMQALAQGGLEAPVGGAMETKFETADPGEMLEGVLVRLQGSGSGSAPVMRDGRLLGMITLENIGELLMIQGALKTRQAKT
ncbi:MAG: site-2 protease family protein [Planctomycetes bacterium]|nr:site-2 protease family protein [Planctomycetota bacterium]